MRNRSYRRSKNNKFLKKTESFLKNCHFLGDVSDISKRRFKNRAICSCSMCGNPRKFFGEETKQELISKQKFFDHISE